MALVFDLKVMPNSGKNKWIIDKSGRLKAYLKSPAQKGLANQELINLLSDLLKMPKQKISILSGALSRIKKIKIDAQITMDQLLSILGIEKQELLFK
jgi:uncharacterized protein (TIGR00251 family)